MGNVVNKTLETLAEPSLGNPASDGMVLSSTTAGVRSWTAISAGGLTNFTEARTATAPNAIIPVHSIKATGTEANIDFAIVPKGTGSLVAQIPDNAITGGIKRGSSAVDLQLTRSSQYQVASGLCAGLLSGSDNRATAQYATVCSGVGNTAGAGYVFVGGGSTNTASGYYSFIGGGFINSAGASYAVICGGQNISVTASYGSILGGSAIKAYLLGQSCSGGYNASSYRTRQDSKLTMQASTTTNTIYEMFIDGATRAVLKNNCAWAFDITILAHSSTNVLHTARFKRSGLILRGATAATTTLEGAVQTIGTDIINSNLTGCAVAISADTTNGSLKVEVTGIAATTIIWQAKIELVEIEI